jgi:hypothetical protein
MMQTPEPKIRNGAYYYDLLVMPTTSHLTTATVNDKEKLVFYDSTFAVGLVTNSYKYGSELQFIAFSRKAPELKARVDKEHGYYRLECGYLPGTHETAEQLRNVADQIDAIINYEPVTFQVQSRSTCVLNEHTKLAEILI